MTSNSGAINTDKSFNGSVKKYFILERDAKILLGVNFFTSVAFTIYSFTLPLYLLTLGYSPPVIGLLTAIGIITMLLVVLPSGYIADRLGRRVPIIAGSLIAGFSFFLFVLMNNFFVFVIASLLHGVSNGLQHPAMNALISEKSSDDTRKYLFTTNALIGMIASAIATFLSGYIPDLSHSIGSSAIAGFGIVFIAGGLMIILRGVGVFFVTEKKSDTSRKKLTLPQNVKMLMLKFALTNSFIGFGAGITIPWFQVYFRLKYGTTLTDIGIIFAVTNIIMAIGMFFMPMIAERKGTVNTIIISQAMAVISLVLIPVSPLFIFVAMLYIIRAVLMNIANPLQGSFNMTLIPSVARATVTSANTFTWTITWALGNFIGGYIIDWNIDANFFVTGIFYVVYIILFYTFFHKYDLQYENTHNVSK